MAFSNQNTTDLSDLLDKLDTFLAANGWTGSHTSGNGRFGQRRTASGVDIGFAAQWDTGTPQNLGIYHFHGAAYNSAIDPWTQNDDSGNGFAGTANANLDDQRYAGIGNTPAQFWVFEEDFYFHVVVQTTALNYLHFGAGALDKFNDWVGGEYVYGQRQETTGSTSVAVKAGTSVLMDGLCKDGGVPNNMEEFAATIHVTGMLNQPAGGLYAVNMGDQAAANLGNDRQGAPKARIKFEGGFRSVPEWGVFHGNVASGLLPGYPIVSFHRDVLGGSPTNDIQGPLGRMKDVRGMSIRNYEPGDEITIGGDTWVIFPTFKKWPGSGALTATSGNQGIVYKKIV